MHEHTVTVCNALMSSEDASIEKSDAAWEIMQTDAMVRDEVHMLATGSGLKLQETDRALFLVPTSTDSPYLARNSESLFPFLAKRRKGAANAEDNALVNFVILRFISLFYDSRTKSYRTSRMFVTLMDLAETVSNDLSPLADAKDDVVPPYLANIAKAWCRRLFRNPDDSTVERANASTRIGLTQGAMRWLKAQHCASSGPGDTWMPTERLDAIVPILFADGRLDQLLDDVRLSAR